MTVAVAVRARPRARWMRAVALAALAVVVVSIPFMFGSFRVGQFTQERLEATGQVASGLVGPVLGRFRVGPALESDIPNIEAPGPVVVDHSVAGRAVQPRRGVLDSLECP